MSGDANLKSFADMKYVDANDNNDIDENELIVKDMNQDNKVSNNEIRQSGIIPSLKTFTSTNYRYCDWNQNKNYDPQEESIIYTPIEPDILGKEDEIVASGTYPILKGFGYQASFIDHNQNNILDDNEAIIIGNGDQVIDENEQIIIAGIATSFDGTNIKYSAPNSSALYTNGNLIADSIDDILEGNEIITAGIANIKNFNSTTDFYIDNNHNGRYDYKVYNSTFGEAIISDITGNPNIVEAGEIKTNGFAGLLTFDGTNYKYSDSGERDQQYNIDELLINDINDDNKVDPSEIVFSGIVDVKNFSEDIKYCDNNRNNQYDGIEAIVISDNDVLDSTDTIWGEGEANLRQFEQNLYRFADSNHDGIYSNGEAIIVEVGWSNADDILEESDIILLAGTADLERFPSEFMFLDDLGNSGEYEDGEAIVYDSNGNSILDVDDEIIKSGRASIKRFVSSERYSDGGINASNSIFDPDEAIIKDGNTDGKLSAGPLDGTGTDAVISPGKAGLRNFNTNEKYVDSNNNSQYDGNEDIYSDEDDNNIVTGEGNDQLVYFVVENIGTAENTDLLNVNLWADRDSDGVFEPYTDDSPKIKSLVKDSLNPKIWYEGPAISPPLSAYSSKNSIGYPIAYDGQRFFVSIDTTNRPIDGRNIQMSIPINGIKTLYGYMGPTDSPIINSYRQYIDSATPSLVRIISPSENDTVYGNVLLRAEAEDTVGIGKVEFYDGQELIGIDDNGSPWEVIWDCSNAGFGLHTLYARAYDKTYLNPPKTNTVNHYLNSNGVNIAIGISYSIQLNSGWNYISLPIEPFDNDVSFIMSSIGANARSIWTYDPINENWLRYDLDGPSFLNDLDIVKAGVGYQIFMTNSGVLNVSGVLPETFISLQDGWNFVGWNSDTSMNTPEAISSIMLNQPSIWTINPTNGEWLGYDPDDPPNDLVIIEPGKAYWVYVVGNCIWQMNSQ